MEGRDRAGAEAWGFPHREGIAFGVRQAEAVGGSGQTYGERPESPSELSPSSRRALLPELSFRGALQIELSGIARPVTLCGPPQELDPTPCVPAMDLALQNPLAYMDRDGAFHFVEHGHAPDAKVVLTAELVALSRALLGEDSRD